MTSPLKKARSYAGMTMVELLIALAAGAIVMLGVYRLLATTLWNYNTQEQMTDMTQNATYTIKRLSEVLAAAGSYLPEKNYAVILYSLAKRDSIELRVNRNNSKFTIKNDTTCTDLRIDSADAFKGADSLLIRDTNEAVTKVKISAVKYATPPDTIVVASSTVFHRYDIIYGANTNRYFLSGTNFCCDATSNVLAENIEALGMTFLDASNAATTNWTNMVSCSLYVRARTLSRDPKYKSPTNGDGYHRLALKMNLRLRNRF